MRTAGGEGEEDDLFRRFAPPSPKGEGKAGREDSPPA